MTFKEKLKQEHSEFIGQEFCGGCRHCPSSYGYEKECPILCGIITCEECWNRKMEQKEN